MEKNRVKITICGTEYTILSEDRESYIRAISDELEQDLLDIMEKNSRLSFSMAATLVALDYVDKLKKMQQRTEALKDEMESYISEIENQKKIIDNLKAENRNLNERNINLNSNMEKVEQKIGVLEKEIKKQKIKDNIEKMKCSRKEITTFSLSTDETGDL